MLALGRALGRPLYPQPFLMPDGEARGWASNLCETGLKGFKQVFFLVGFFFPLSWEDEARLVFLEAAACGPVSVPFVLLTCACFALG